MRCRHFNDSLIWYVHSNHILVICRMACDRMVLSAALCARDQRTGVGRIKQVLFVPTRKNASYQLKNDFWHFTTWILRKKLDPIEPYHAAAERMTES